MQLEKSHFFCNFWCVSGVFPRYIFTCILPYCVQRTARAMPNFNALFSTTVPLFIYFFIGFRKWFIFCKPRAYEWWYFLASRLRVIILSLSRWSFFFPGRVISFRDDGPKIIRSFVLQDVCPQVWLLFRRKWLYVDYWLYSYRYNLHKLFH